MPGPGGLGTELSLFECRKQLSSGRREHMGEEFGPMPGKEAVGVVGPAGPRKSPKEVRPGLGGVEREAEP